MTPAWPEGAYRRAAAHWQGCAVCSDAGGEEAALVELCPTGRQLMLTWERAEMAWALAEVETPLGQELEGE